MITSLEIEGLRGIESGKIEGLAPLTVLLGANGSGKSTVLEALGVACAAPDAEAAFRILCAREWLGPDAIGSWFRNGRSARVGVVRSGATLAGSTDVTLSWAASAGTGRAPDELVGSLRVLLAWHSSATAVHEGRGDAKAQPDGTLVAETPEVKTFLAAQLAETNNLGHYRSGMSDRSPGDVRRYTTGVYSSAYRQALNALRRTPLFNDLLAAMQTLLPGLQSIESLPSGNRGDRDEPHMILSNPHRVFPLAFAGDGFRHAFLLAQALLHKTALLDEPDAHLHPSMQERVAQLLRTATNSGTQVVIATHSLEFLRVLVAAFGDQQEKLAVIGLRMQGAKLDPLVIRGEDVHYRVSECRDDLRL